MLGRSFVLLSIIAAPALSQGTAAAPPGRSSTDYARTLWKEVRTYLTKAAADAPEALYDYKPTTDVRSYGEMLDHVAASQDGYCRVALGEKPVRGGARTGAKTKAEVIEALRASNEICTRAYAQDDREAALPAYEGDKRSRLYVLLENAMHDNEHYGNLVTYLRLNHLVPPSSQPAPATP
jgi:uncharacterized damage-inducible protein DinB